MASGNFPIDKYCGGHKEIKAAIREIDAALNEIEVDCYQFDNAASDGGYRERIYIAKEMLKAVIK